jgi:hypothetical protein
LVIPKNISNQLFFRTDQLHVRCKISPVLEIERVVVVCSNNSLARCIMSNVIHL